MLNQTTINFLVGPSFSGKSTVAASSGLLHIDTDAIRDALTDGNRAEADIEQTRRVVDVVLRAAAARQDVVLEWSYWPNPDERDWVRRTAAEIGANLRLIVFDNEDETAQRRADTDDKAKLKRTKTLDQQWPELRDALREEASLYDEFYIVAASATVPNLLT